VNYLGIGISIFGLVISFIIDNPESIAGILLLIGIIPTVLSAIFSGALTSGNRIRANYSDKEDFKERMSLSTTLFLLGAPCLLTSFAIYYFS
jgi:uncharacterized membrane protein YphA (DoxX/SURF4 family)